MSTLRIEKLRSYGLLLIATIVVGLGVYLHAFSYSMDEARAWIIATSSNLADLPEILRFEGHLPLWYLLLKLLSWVSPSPLMLQVLSGFCGLSALGILLLRSPFSTAEKGLLCLNFYLIYQYTILARLYSLEMLLLFLLATFFRSRWTISGRYLSVLSLLCCTSIFGAAFAGIFFTEYLIHYLRGKRKQKCQDLRIAGTTVIFFLAAWFILSTPANTYANHHLQEMDWLHPVRWQKIFTFIGSAVYLIVTPGEFWGRSLGLDQGNWNSIYLVLTSIFLLAGAWVFRKNVRSLWIFSGTTLLTVLFIYLIRFSAFNGNYYGHFTLGFLLASWIYRSETTDPKWHRLLLITVLTAQAYSGIVAMVELAQRPFSRGRDVARHLEAHSVREVIPGIWAYTSSYLVHSNVRYFEDGKLVRFTLSKSSMFLPDEYQHAIVPTAYSGLMNQEHHQEIMARIRSRFCQGVPNLRVVTNSRPSLRFRETANLREEASFTGAIHPMDNFYVYRFEKSPKETQLCLN